MAFVAAPVAGDPGKFGAEVFGLEVFGLVPALLAGDVLPEGDVGGAEAFTTG